MKNKIILLVLTLSIISCKKFLDEPPAKSANVPIETMEDLDNLINGTYLDKQPVDKMSALVLTDDYHMRPTLNSKLYNFYIDEPYTGFRSYILDREFLSTNNECRFDWTLPFRQIATVNVVLEHLDKVTSGDRDEPNLKIKLEAEAKAIRAYTHFVLMLKFCQHPKSPNSNKLGIPYRYDTSFESDISRGTVQRTMERIKGDINDAQRLFEQIGLEDLDLKRKSRISKTNLMAIKAKIALYEGDYKTAYDASSYVLTKYSLLEDLNNDKDDKAPYYQDSVITNYIYNGGNDTIYIKRLTSNIIVSTRPYGENLFNNVEVLYKSYITTCLKTPSKDLYSRYHPKDLRKIKFYDNNIFYSWLIEEKFFRGSK